MTPSVDADAERIFSKAPDPQAKSYLLQLPWELRQMILQLILTHDEMLQPRKFLRGAKRYPNLIRLVEFMESLPSYFHICQQVYREAVLVFFTTNTFRVNVHFMEGTLISVLQRWKMYPYTITTAIDFEDRAPSWLRSDLVENINPGFRKARSFHLAINGLKSYACERIYLASYILAALLKDKDVTVSLFEGWVGHDKNGFQHLTPKIPALRNLCCRSFRITYAPAPFFPGTEGFVPECVSITDRIRYEEWLKTAIEGDTTEPDLLEQYSSFARKSLPLFPGKYLKDWYVHDDLRAAVKSSMIYGDQDAFNIATQAIKEAAEAFFTHRSMCNETREVCKTLHSEVWSLVHEYVDSEEDELGRRMRMTRIFPVLREKKSWSCGRTQKRSQLPRIQGVIRKIN